MKITNFQSPLLLVLLLKFILLAIVIYLWMESQLLTVFTYFFHYLYDIISIIIALIASMLSTIKADQYSFSYYRYTILASLLNGIFLLFMNMQILINVITKLIFVSSEIKYEHHLHDHHMQLHSETYLLYFMLAKLIINFFCIYILHKNAEPSLSLRVVLLHIISDVLMEFMSLFSFLFIIYTQLSILDSLGSIIILMIISIQIFNVIKKSIQILCNGSPDNIQTDKLIYDLKIKFKLIKQIYHVHIWYLTETKFISSMHIIIEPSYQKALDILAINEYLLKHFNIVHNTIQIETKNYDIEKTTCLP